MSTAAYDSVSRFLLENLDIRGALVRLGPAWHEMRSRHAYAPPVRDLLGQLAAVTVLVAGNLKLPGRLTCQLQGHGPVRLLVMDCDEQLRLRGLAKAPADQAPAALPELFGDGKLVLTLQTNVAAGRPYQSIVPLEGGSVGEVFEHFLENSEQTPTRLWLSADEDHACGLFLQKLPEADTRDEDGWNRVLHLAGTVKPGELALPPEVLLKRLFAEEDLRLYDARTVTYHCPRDEEKVLGMLRSLGRAEVAEALAEQGELKIRDDICQHEYRYGEEILDRLFPPRTLH